MIVSGYPRIIVVALPLNFIIGQFTLIFKVSKLIIVNVKLAMLYVCKTDRLHVAMAHPLNNIYYLKKRLSNSCIIEALTTFMSYRSYRESLI